MGENSKQTGWIPYLIIGILLLIMALGGFFTYRYIKSMKVDLISAQTELLKEQMHIDSLNRVIDCEKEQIISLKDSVKIVTKVVTKEVERIKYLPVDSNVLLLTENIKKYGEVTDALDTLPAIVELNSEDTIVALSENNLIDINCVFAKYEGSLEENELLYQIIDKDSNVIALQDSVILSKDFIISKQDSIFDANMKELKRQAKKDIVKSGIIGGSIGAAVVAIISTAIVLSTGK